jgi:hypothetical protein
MNGSERALQLPPMSQYDSAAMPMYASFGTEPVVTLFNAMKPLIDVTAKNTPKSYGAKESSRMNFSEPDRAPMHAPNLLHLEEPTCTSQPKGL